MAVELRARSVLVVAADGGGTLLVAGVGEVPGASLRARLDGPLAAVPGRAAWRPRWAGEELIDVVLDCRIGPGASDRVRVLFALAPNVRPLARLPTQVLVCSERSLARAGRLRRFGSGLVLPPAPVAALAELVV